ncbi:hypothetical protein L1887_36067 [Cichorium endivia]|nr:hypothetical protein L1887_36067 [Cichorium endivia]
MTTEGTDELLHSLLQCPKYISIFSKQRFYDRLNKFRRRKIQLAPVMDWDAAKNVALSVELEPLFIQERIQNSRVEFTFHAWAKIFRMMKWCTENWCWNFFQFHDGSLLHGYENQDYDFFPPKRRAKLLQHDRIHSTTQIVLA